MADQEEAQRVIRELAKTFKDIEQSAANYVPKEREGTITAVLDEDSESVMVQLDGSSLPTPAVSLVSVHEDDRVRATIRDHTVTITGNITDPMAALSDLDGVEAELIEVTGGIALQISDLNGNVATLTTSINGISQTIKNIQGDISSLTVSVNGITGRVEDAEGNISELKQTSTSLTSRIESAEGDISTITQTVNGMSVTLENVSQSALDAMNAADDAAEAAAAAQSTANTANQTANTANQTANTANQTANTAKSAAQSAQTAANDAKKVATNYLQYTSNGLEVGYLASSSSTRRNVLITSQDVKIRQGTTVLAQFGTEIVLGVSSRTRLELSSNSIYGYVGSTQAIRISLNAGVSTIEGPVNGLQLTSTADGGSMLVGKLAYPRYTGTSDTAHNMYTTTKTSNNLVGLRGTALIAYASGNGTRSVTTSRPVQNYGWLVVEIRNVGGGTSSTTYALVKANAGGQCFTGMVEAGTSWIIFGAITSSGKTVQVSNQLSFPINGYNIGTGTSAIDCTITRVWGIR